MNVSHRNTVPEGTSVSFKKGEQPPIFKVIGSIMTHALMGHFRMVRLFA